MSTSDVLQLIQEDIPTGRQNLQENHANLQLLAQHCEEQYHQAEDKRKALEETKDYTTHSLASVAYQIHNLASNFLNLLDKQQTQLSGMESSINHLSQIVNIHKEKVARREIGVLTTNRTSMRNAGTKNGIIFPEQTERPVKYQRKPVDYGALDSVGHGVRSPSSAPMQNSRPVSLHSQGAPTTLPPTPPMERSGSISSTTSSTAYGTLGRNQGAQYRSVPPPVAPPHVPANQQYAQGNYTDRQSHQGARDRYEQLYAPSMMGMVHSPPPLGQNRPSSDIRASALGDIRVSRIQDMRASGIHRDSLDSSQLPPPPPPELTGEGGVNSLGSTVSPPPPPPPPDSGVGYDYDSQPPPPPPEFSDPGSQPPPPPDDPYMETGPQLMLQPDWVPQVYMEKVVAIFDYEAQKEDELTFNENALIYVIKKNEDDWWEGVMDGRTGLFPSNYVEPCI